MNDIDWDSLPPTTVPQDTRIAVQGFTNVEAAQQLSAAVADAISTLGSFMDLSTLDGVTVAVEYDDALTSLDRGMNGLRPLTRSNREEMQGVAMSPAVLREGGVLTHLVFDAGMLVSLIVDGAADEDRWMSIGIIAHECAHVQITAEKERAIPEARLGSAIEDYERAIMFQLAEICWDEYAACRISATFAKDQNNSHADTLKSCVSGARARSNDAIKAYRVHGDLNRLVGEAGAELCQPMKAAAYLLGGMDGEGADWSFFPDVRSALQDGEFADLVDELWTELRRLWETRSDWRPTLQVFKRLENLAREVFQSGGIHFRTASDGSCSIQVPFTTETMP